MASATTTSLDIAAVTQKETATKKNMTEKLLHDDVSYSSSKLGSDYVESGGNLSSNTGSNSEDNYESDDECAICNDGGGEL